MPEEMKVYKVTIHQHTIYDYIIEAPNRQLAEEEAEDSILNDDQTLWREDKNAGWTEIGEIYLEEDGEYDA